MNIPSEYRKLVAVRSSDNLREAVEIQTVPMPELAADELLVRTRYSGVNAADYLVAAGRYLAPTPPPYDLGAEALGEVVAVGAEVQGLAVGMPVLALGGGHCEYFTVQARRAMPVPELRPELITLGISGLTASIALQEAGAMSSGETVLVSAAAGGTGSFVVQLAKIAGNHVIGTCGSAEKADFLRSIGCDRPINYREESLKDVLKTEYPKGVDIVFESVGGETFDTCLKALAVKGRLIAIGAISEYEKGPEIVSGPRVLYALLQKSASIRGFWLAHYFRQAPEHLAKLLGLMQAGKLQAAVDPARFVGLEGAIGAIEHMYRGANVGKVVVEYPA